MSNVVDIINCNTFTSKCLAKNALYLDIIGEGVYREPSQTVPDQVDNIADLVKKFVRGEIDVNQLNAGAYTEDMPDLPLGIERLDAVDRLDMARSYEEFSNKQREKLRKRQQPPISPPAPPSTPSPDLPAPGSNDAKP